MTDLFTPIDRYLAEQQDSTAVERFARRHDEGLLDSALVEPGLYADRLPLARPGAGEQYAFRVDLDQCTGCKSCVAACHSLNGLDEGESWRTVGLLVGSAPADPRLQTVPSGCHHCVDPACLSGCPTNAYEKDPFSGIVRHLDDQCFGCGYCELTCPYEVPRMNERLGVVRKCDLCADRLEEGEAPACVQACPTSAITVTVVDTQQVLAESQGSVLVPGAPDSAITAPTTQYVGERPVPDDLVAADHHALRPSASHPPLAFMLVMTQLSVGMFVAGLAVRSTPTVSVAAVAGVVALGGAFFHLGRPSVAWRAVLGVAHSWFSREVVAFSGYAGLAGVHAVGTGTDLMPDLVVLVAGVGAAVCGIAGVVCSAMIYVVTRRTWWQPRHALTKFGLSTAASGSAAAALVFRLADDPVAWVRAVTVVGVCTLVVKLADEASLLRPGRWQPGSDLGRTARLLLTPLRTSTRWRFSLGVAGALGLLAVMVGAPTVVLAAALVAIVAGELIERYQFFVASVAPRMPGGFRR